MLYIFYKDQIILIIYNYKYDNETVFNTQLI